MSPRVHDNVLIKTQKKEVENEYNKINGDPIIMLTLGLPASSHGLVFESRFCEKTASWL